jgi:hypothetical protein
MLNFMTNVWGVIISVAAILCCAGTVAIFCIVKPKRNEARVYRTLVGSSIATIWVPIIFYINVIGSPEGQSHKLEIFSKFAFAIDVCQIVFLLVTLIFIAIAVKSFVRDIVA